MTSGGASEYIHVVEISPRAIRCIVYDVKNGLPLNSHRVLVQVNNSSELLAVENYFSGARELTELEITDLERQFSKMAEHHEGSN